MKTKISSIIAITLIVSGMSTFTSCIGAMEDTADSLVDAIANKIVDKDGTERKLEQQKQERFDNMVNWVVGKETDQETINKFGYDNCFQVTEVPTTIWDKVGTDGISPEVNIGNLCYVRFLNYSYSLSGHAPHIAAIICDRRIANDLLSIFRQLYESKYVIVQTDVSMENDRQRMKLLNVTYGYYYTPKNAKRIPMALQQGMAVVVNDGEHLTRTDLAVRLFKEKGFTWGGDEPDGNPNYFTK